jgi:hypothetical protein
VQSARPVIIGCGAGSLAVNIDGRYRRSSPRRTDGHAESAGFLTLWPTKKRTDSPPKACRYRAATAAPHNDGLAVINHRLSTWRPDCQRVAPDFNGEVTGLNDIDDFETKSLYPAINHALLRGLNGRPALDHRRGVYGSHRIGRPSRWTAPPGRGKLPARVQGSPRDASSCYLAPLRRGFFIRGRPGSCGASLDPFRVRRSYRECRASTLAARIIDWLGSCHGDSRAASGGERWRPDRAQGTAARCWKENRPYTDRRPAHRDCNGDTSSTRQERHGSARL